MTYTEPLLGGTPYGRPTTVVTRLRADEERRAEVWEGLLYGMAEDPAFALEAVRTLELVGGPYVAIEVEDGDPIDVGRTCRSASWLRRHTGSVGLVTVGRSGVGDLAAFLGEHATHPVGMSAPVSEPHQLARAFGQASAAVRIRAGRPGVTLFDDVLPEALLLGSPAVTEHLVSRWLGPLLTLPEPERRELLLTLDAWVRSGCSASAAGSIVYCHRNTVLNRLRRISALLGRDLSGPVPLELALALRAACSGYDR